MANRSGLNRQTIFLVVIVLPFCLSLCCKDNSASPTQPPVEIPAGIVHSLNGADSGKTVSVSWGDTVNISLGFVGPGSFHTPTVSSTCIIYNRELPVLPNPGGPSEISQFIAVRKGSANILISTSRDAYFFTVNINVE